MNAVAGLAALLATMAMRVARYRGRWNGILMLAEKQCPIKERERGAGEKSKGGGETR